MVQRNGHPQCLVVLGASAGGIPALLRLLEDLPETLPAAMLLVLHIREAGSAMLPQVLSRGGALNARFAVDGEPLQPGCLVIAPPDMHLLVTDAHLELSRGPRENGHRPSVDCLFRSAAKAYGPGVIGVILSGALSDGTLGLAEVKRLGGTAIVQADPVHAGMPESALQAVAVDHVVPAAGLGAVLAELVPAIAEGRAQATRTADDVPSNEDLFGLPASGLTCPECGGALWAFDVSGVQMYVCHVGHRYSEAALDLELNAAIERAVLAAVRALEERAALQRQLASRLNSEDHPKSLARASRAAEEADRQADLIRRTLLDTPAADAAGAQDEEREREVRRGGSA